MSAGWEALSCRICRSKILTPRNQQVGLVGEAPCRNHSNHLPSSHHHRIWGVGEVLLLVGLGNCRQRKGSVKKKRINIAFLQLKILTKLFICNNFNSDKNNF